MSFDSVIGDIKSVASIPSSIFSGFTSSSMGNITDMMSSMLKSLEPFIIPLVIGIIALSLILKLI